MRIDKLPISDVYITSKFVEDWKKATPRAKKSVNRIIKQMAQTGQFANGFKPHEAQGATDYYIGYVSQWREAWRILFYIYPDTYGLILEFDRLLRHKEMDRWTLNI